MSEKDGPTALGNRCSILLSYRAVARFRCHA
jgi:hypothetical protein